MMQIRTERLLLQPLSMDDLAAAHEYVSDPQNANYMVDFPNADLPETQRYIQKAVDEWKKDSPNFYEFSVTLEGRHIGMVSLYLNAAHTEGELGWIIHKDYWGNGYITEAALAVKEFAANGLRLKRLVAHCDSRNIASYRVMEKIGLALERDDNVRYNKGAAEPSVGLIYSLKL